MQRKAGYKGYQSYSYLRKGIDYKDFKLCKEIDRVEPYVVPLSDAQVERLERLVAANPVVGLHEHSAVLPDDITELRDYEHSGRESTAFEGMAYSCFDAVFDNLMDGTCVITSATGWKWNDIIHDLGMRQCDIAHQDFFIQGFDLDDIAKAKAAGKIAWFAALESSTPIENELDRIEVLYGLGVRMMGIVYSESNTLGSGLKEKRDGGLTAFGRDAVDRMNRIGMAIDLSHASEQTTLDTIEVSTKPVFITHVGARALWDMKRLKSDDTLKACAAKGGVIGVEAAPHTTITKNHPTHDIDAIMEHFDYIVNLVGIDHVTFGLDIIYGDHVGLHGLFSQNMSLEATQKGQEFPHVPYVRGVENPTEGMWNILRAMIARGYSDEDIAKAAGGNTIRVLKEAWRQKG